jgi:hypothetical protein
MGSGQAEGLNRSGAHEEEAMNGVQTRTEGRMKLEVKVATDTARRVLNTAEIARYCGVPNEEVLGWIDNGMLKASYIPVGRYRVNVDDFVVFLSRYEVQF